MTIFWVLLIVSMIVWLETSLRFTVVPVNTHYEEKSYGSQGGLFFALLIVVCGLRSGIGDTGTYILMFNGYPTNIADIVSEEISKDKGFYYLSVLYKQFISTDFHGWLFIITLVSAVAVFIAFRRYSTTFGYSCFLFIATTMFVYLLNGMRQFICVSIVFLCTRWITERNFFRFFVLILLLSTIHQSVLIFIPIYFLVYVPPWSKLMMLITAGSALIGARFMSILPIFSSLLEDTQYSEYSDYIVNEGVGVNIIRVLIAAVPCVLSFMYRHYIEDEADDIIRFSVNMSILNLCLYIIAIFTSGMAVGRLTTYFDIYNLLLLPWILKYAVNERLGQIMTLGCTACYIAFFYYQMVVTYGMNYISDILMFI